MRGTEARKRARARLGEPFPNKQLGEDGDGVRRVASACSRADTRPCGESCPGCGLEFELGYRPDPCLGGYLPGVAHACCGHDDPTRAYVTLGGVPDQAADTISGMRTLRGARALAVINELRPLATSEPLA